jgi:hypothetical protein
MRFTPNFRGGLTSYITIHMQQNTILDENDNPKPNKEKKFAFIAGLDDPSLDSAKQVVISRHDMSYQDTMTYIHQSYLTNQLQEQIRTYRTTRHARGRGRGGGRGGIGGHGGG